MSRPPLSRRQKKKKKKQNCGIRETKPVSRLLSAATTVSVGQKRSQTQTQYQLWLTIGQQFSGYLPVCRFDFVFVTLLSYTRFFSHYFCFAERKPNERLRRQTRFGLGGENTSGRGFYGLLSSSLASFNCLPRSSHHPIWLSSTQRWLRGCDSWALVASIAIAVVVAGHFLCTFDIYLMHHYATVSGNKGTEHFRVEDTVRLRKISALAFVISVSFSFWNMIRKTLN